MISHLSIVDVVVLCVPLASLPESYRVCGTYKLHIKKSNLGTKRKRRRRKRQQLVDKVEKGHGSYTRVRQQRNEKIYLVNLCRITGYAVCEQNICNEKTKTNCQFQSSKKKKRKLNEKSCWECEETKRGVK